MNPLDRPALLLVREALGTQGSPSAQAPAGMGPWEEFILIPGLT